MNGIIEPITASMLVIGDEILSGRTRDVNVGFVAENMTAIGIDLIEVRIVGDDQAAIVEAVNALRARTTYVFTSGGIGPTHDDITADAVSAAFGVPCEEHPEALEILAGAYAEREMELTAARRRMARTPRGATLIENRISHAPGFRMENVHVMAGVPKIMQAMLGAVIPTLRTGRKLVSRSLVCPHGEGIVGGPLAAVQQAHPDVAIGSYPQWNDGRFTTEIVVRGRDEASVDKGLEAVARMVRELPTLS